MKIEVTCEPVFYLPLTLEDARLLQHLAQHHYDARCKTSGLLGGFLYGWVNLLTPAPDAPDHQPKARATWSQMDVTLKVLEIRHSGLLHGRDADAKRADELAWHLRVALAQRPYIKPADTTIDTESGAAARAQVMPRNWLNPGN